MLSAQSDHFQRLVNNENFIEGETSSMRFDEDEPFAVKGLLQFLYTGDYEGPALDADPSRCATAAEDIKASEPCKIHPASFHAHMLGMGNMYMLPKLEALAEQRICSSLALLNWGDEDLVSAAQAVFALTSEDHHHQRVRRKLTEVLMRHIHYAEFSRQSHSVSEREEAQATANKEQIMEMLQQERGAAVAVAVAALERIVDLSKCTMLRCGECRRVWWEPNTYGNPRWVLKNGEGFVKCLCEREESEAGLRLRYLKRRMDPTRSASEDW